MGKLYNGAWQKSRETVRRNFSARHSKMGKFKVRSSGRNRKALQPRSRAAPYFSSLCAIPPRRTSNDSRRSRECLTPAEVEKLLQASAKVGRQIHHKPEEMTGVIRQKIRRQKADFQAPSSRCLEHASLCRRVGPVPSDHQM
jgi:hypothetical protein